MPTTTHPDDRVLYELIDNELTPERRREVIAHVDSCHRCMNRLRLLVVTEQALQDAWEHFRKGCPTPETLYAYSEGELPGDERAAVEAHLKVCAICEFVLQEGTAMSEECALL